MPPLKSLAFSIRTLDMLFGPKYSGEGMPLPVPPHTTSLCLIGPDGTGKSVFALHIADAYFNALHSNGSSSDTRVLYVSTDLKYNRAVEVMTNFGRQSAAKLRHLPADGDLDAITSYLLGSDDNSELGFIDLAASSAGDDWGFISRLLACVPDPLNSDSPRHLLIIDAVEGLETMVGTRDAYGKESTRRERVANLMRLAEKKAHIVLVVEEADEGQRNPEEFIVDCVLRLRTSLAGNLTRRTLEIEKARALAGYAHGRHPFSIEKVGPEGPHYMVEVFPALPSLADERDATDDATASVHFGLKYLDSMLTAGGIRPKRVAAIVGEPSTLKSELGSWFLAGVFEEGAPKGMAILLSSHPDREPGLEESTRIRALTYDKRYASCEALPLADLPSAQVYWTIRRRIESAIKLYDDMLRPSLVGDSEFTHRVVIDDISTLRDVYPEIAQDSLFLPKLISLLESTITINRKSITTKHVFAPIIIATQDGRPGVQPADRFDQTLRNLTGLRIHAWHVEFYGQQRVAISTNTLAQETEPVIVRELCRRRGSSSSTTELYVDPHFELYRDVELGKPERIALEIKMFSETESFDKYIAMENGLLNEIFLAYEGNQRKDVITKISPENYEALRDLCNLRAGTNSDHTLVLQVDEFWDPPPSTFRSQVSYLRDFIIHKDSGRADAAEDILAVFDASASCQDEVRSRQDAAKASKDTKATNEHLNRSDLFVVQGRTRSTGTPDRVPFMWDFGFLLLDRDAWLDASERRLHNLSKSAARRGGTQDAANEPKAITVGDVWAALRTPKERRPPVFSSLHDSVGNAAGHRNLDIGCCIEGGGYPLTSWRAFLEAALEVARIARLGRKTQVHAFDASVISGESISALILEMWMSEIYLQEKRRALTGTPKKRTADEFSRILSASPTHIKVAIDLPDLLTDYRDELYMVFLLLIEVLDFDNITAPNDPYTFKVRPGNEPSVASRHWYKTAVIAEQTQFMDRPSTPARLPGHFSVRGDWYLAVAAGSRSSRLANLGMDFLNARRSNLTRLQMGLGLPVRDICGIEEYKGLRTALTYFSESPTKQDTGRRVSLPYWDLFAELGACAGWLRTPLKRESDEFYWMWRYRIAQYGRHARIWENFILTMIRFWRRVRMEEGGQWENGFDVYDRMYEADPVQSMAQTASVGATHGGGRIQAGAKPRIAGSPTSAIEALHSYTGFTTRVEKVAAEMKWVPKRRGSEVIDD